ncbi:MAG: hypothetical protein H3C53_06700 [Trueperaceae bacterium]|nr:hypothetical protein [Trueperaceae bacterium]
MASTAHATAWTCPACGQVNLAGVTCDRCGVAKRMLDDPPLDIPYRPQLTRTPAFWLGVVWTLVTLLGALFLLSPAGRAAVGPLFLVAQTFGAAAAAVSSFFTAHWHRLFNQVEVEVPQQVKAGEPLEATVRLVPYEPLAGVTVRLRLVDRFYRETKDGSVETAQQRLEERILLTRGRVPGRRSTRLSATFLAPFPMTPHSSFQAEAAADLLSMLAYVIPSLSWQARNLREHGGYYVEAHVRVGFLSRRYHKRVLTYYVGADLFVG